jgi:hypothetical protein
LDEQQHADMRDESTLLAQLEAPGAAVTYILNWQGLDVILITDSITGHSILVEPDVVDSGRGGSVHAQARAELEDLASGDREPDDHVRCD